MNFSPAETSPAPAAVYQRERSGGSFTYTFPHLTPGRVFNVAINNAPVLQNFNIIAAAGAANTAIVEQFAATADASGNITITYSTASADRQRDIVNGSQLARSMLTCNGRSCRVRVPGSDAGPLGLSP